MNMGEKLLNEIWQRIRYFEIKFGEKPKVILLNFNSHKMLYTHVMKTNYAIRNIEDFFLFGVKVFSSPDLDDNQIELLTPDDL